MQVPPTSRSFKPHGSRRPWGTAWLPGLTLLEMTMVLMVLFSLVSILFVGASVWKRGTERALCVVNIQAVQKAVRSHANLYGLDPGANVPGLKAQLIGPGRYIEKTPICNSPGIYSFGQAYGEDTIPPVGTLYMECSLSTTKRHKPDSASDW